MSGLGRLELLNRGCYWVCVFIWQRVNLEEWSQSQVPTGRQTSGQRNNAADSYAGKKAPCVLRERNGMQETWKNKFMVPHPCLEQLEMAAYSLERLETLPEKISFYGVSFFFIQQVSCLSAWPSQRSGTQCFCYLLVIYWCIFYLRMPRDFPLYLKSSRLP